jgi:short-subunit dehydrogenase
MDTSFIRGKRVLITGASGGIGQHLCESLAAAGTRLFLVAYPGIALRSLSEELLGRGAESTCFLEADVSSPEGRQRIVDDAVTKLGGVDIVIHNAGVEHTCVYHELDEAKVTQVLRVNLEAPMLLTRQLLPLMLAQGGGSIILMSSLAGKAGPACQESYAASKAGLIGFGQSLRATYSDKNIRTTVITPGFVSAGIYERLERDTKSSAPSLLGVSPPSAVVSALWRALRDSPPEIIVNPVPVKPLLVFNTLFPTLGEKLARLIGANDFFQRAAAKLRAAE